MTQKQHLNAYRGFAMPVVRGGRSVAHIIDEIGEGVSPKQLGQFTKTLVEIYHMQLRTASRAGVILAKRAFNVALKVQFPNQLPTGFEGVQLPVPFLIPGPSFARNIHEIISIYVNFHKDIGVGASLTTGVRIAKAVMTNFGHPSPAVD